MQTGAVKPRQAFPNMSRWSVGETIGVVTNVSVDLIRDQRDWHEPHTIHA
jgi:hypothetical protein